MTVNFIWQIKHKDNTVLLSTRAVKKGLNYIAFSVEPKYTHLYSVSNETIIKCPVQKNGKGSVYIIPFNELKDEGLLPEQYLNQKHDSYVKYLEWKANLKN